MKPRNPHVARDELELAQGLFAELVLRLNKAAQHAPVVLEKEILDLKRKVAAESRRVPALMSWLLDPMR